MSELKKSMEIVREALKTDPSYRVGWKANIAVQFQDEWQRFIERNERVPTRREVHKMSNNAATAFLNLLCADGHMEFDK